MILFLFLILFITKIFSSNIESLDNLIDCKAVISTKGRSDERVVQFYKQMHDSGINTSNIDLLERPFDHEHTDRGIWNSHIYAWNHSLAKGCNNVMVFENDAFFANDDVTHHSLINAINFLKSGKIYDILLLGFSINKMNSTNIINQIDKCIYQIPQWDSLHAYIINKQAILNYQHLQWYLPNKKKKHNLDMELHSLTNEFGIKAYIVYPEIAFQSMHQIENRWNGMQTKKQEDIAMRKSIPHLSRIKTQELFNTIKSSHECIIPKPTVYIIGVQKCGTTTLHQHLSKFPQMIPPTNYSNEPSYFKKEIHFWGYKRYNNGIQFYNDHFPDNKPSDSYYYESTPNYFFKPMVVISRMKDAYGSDGFNQLKFILIVKDPIERLESFWNHFRYNDQMEEYPELKKYNDINDYISRNMHNSKHKHPTPQNAKIWNFGNYYLWFDKWIKNGVNPNQFHIILLDELFNYNYTMRNLIQFLSINKTSNIAIIERNSNKIVKKANQHDHTDILDDELKGKLKTYYKPLNCKFMMMIDKLKIRSWEEMIRVSTGWIPSKTDCHILSTDTIIKL